MDIRDTYSVDFNAEKAIAMASRLAKAMDSLGTSLSKVKTDGMSNLNSLVTTLDSSKIRSSIKAVQDLESLNKTIARIASTTPDARGISRLATSMQQVSTAMTSLGTGMTGMTQFVSGVTQQMTSLATDLQGLQTAFNNVKSLDSKALQTSMGNLLKAFDPTFVTALQTQATSFSQATDAAFKQVYTAVKSVSKITDEMRKLSNFAISNNTKGVGQKLQKQIMDFVNELHAFQNIKLPTDRGGTFAPGLLKFSRELNKTVSQVVTSLTPLYAIMSESKKAVTASASFGQNLNAIITNINKAGASGGIASPNAQALAAIRTNVLQLHSALKGLEPSLRAINTAQQMMGNNFQQTGKVATESGRNIALSWGSVMRLFEAHVLSRGLYAFTNAVRQSVKESAELVKAVGEIQTISQRVTETGRPIGLMRSMQELYQDSKRISDVYGLAQKDVIEAGYEAVSNQVKGAAENFDFLESSAKFAKAAVTTLDNSVKLLSATLMSYNMSVTQTDRIAAIFFKTIELGRLRANDLASDIGRSAVLANQLGVSLEELSAAFATSTVQGIQFRNAQTYINNVMLKLVKPTDVMRDAFHRMGVDSGESAIAVYGFMGAMQKFYQVAQDAPDEMGELGKLFGTIRGILGASIFKNSVDLYEENLAKIRASQESYMMAFTTMMQNTGDSFLREMNKIKTHITSAYGKEIVEVLTRLTSGEFIGGLANAIKMVTAIGAAFVGFMGIIKAWSMVAIAAQTAIAKTVVIDGVTKSLSAAQLVSAQLSKSFMLLAGGAGVAASAFLMLAPVVSAWLSSTKISEDEFQRITQKNKENAEKMALFKTRIIADQISMIDDLSKRVFRGSAQQISEQIRIIREDASSIESSIKSMDKAFEFTVRTTKSGMDEQQASYNGFKRTLENVIMTTQNLGKEFRGSTAEIIKDLKAIDSFSMNVNRSLESYMTSIQEASLAEMPSEERQVIFDQAGYREFMKGQQYFSSGYMDQAQKSFQAAIGYFTKSKDAYIEMMKSFGGGQNFSAINLDDFMAKIQPIQFFMNSVVSNIFESNRQNLLNKFSKTWEQILYQGQKLTGQTYQETVSLTEDPSSALRRGDPEFADIASKRLRSLNEEIRKLPAAANEITSSFNNGMIGLEDYVNGIEEVQKKLVELGQEETQIMGDVSSRQSELAQTRTNAIAAARELFKTTGELFRQRRDTTDVRQQFEIDRQLVELQTRFSTFQKEVGYNFKAEFIETMENERATLLQFLAQETASIDKYTEKYFKGKDLQAELDAHAEMYSERIRLQKEYDKLRFSDRDADKKEAQAARDKLATLRLEIAGIEDRNARLREYGNMVSEKQSFERAITSKEDILAKTYAGGDPGTIMAEDIARTRMGYKDEAEFQRLQKQQMGISEEIQQNLKNLSDTTGATSEVEGDLQVSINGLIDAFSETGSWLQELMRGGSPKLSRYLVEDESLGLKRERISQGFGEVGPARVYDTANKLAEDNVKFLEKNLALLQSKDLTLRQKAADALSKYMTSVLSKIDINAKGVLRETGEEVVRSKVDFEELTKTIAGLGETFKDELEAWNTYTISAFKTPMGISDRLSSLQTAEAAVQEIIAQLNSAGANVPDTLLTAVDSFKQYRTYFEQQQKDMGKFDITDIISKALDKITPDETGKSIYEQMLLGNDKALAAIKLSGENILTELKERVKGLGLDLKITDLKSIQDIMTAPSDKEGVADKQREDLRTLFASFGSVDQQALETQKSSLEVLKGIATSTSTMAAAVPAPEPIKRASGGRVPNTPNLSKPYGTDSVLAALTPGEFVIRKEAVQSIGTPYLDMLNKSGMISKKADGGLESYFYAKNRSNAAPFNSISGLLNADFFKEVDSLITESVLEHTKQFSALSDYVRQTMGNAASGTYFEKMYGGNSWGIGKIQSRLEEMSGIKEAKSILGDGWGVTVSNEGASTNGEVAHDLVARLQHSDGRRITLSAHNFKYLITRGIGDFAASRYDAGDLVELSKNLQREERMFSSRAGDELGYYEAVFDKDTNSTSLRSARGQLFSERNMSELLYPSSKDVQKMTTPDINSLFGDLAKNIHAKTNQIGEKKSSSTLGNYLNGIFNTKDLFSEIPGLIFEGLPTIQKQLSGYSIQQIALLSENSISKLLSDSGTVGPSSSTKYRQSLDLIKARAGIKLLGISGGGSIVKDFASDPDKYRASILNIKSPRSLLKSLINPERSFEYTDLPKIFSDQFSFRPKSSTNEDFLAQALHNQPQMPKDQDPRPHAFIDKIVGDFIKQTYPDLINNEDGIKGVFENFARRFPLPENTSVDNLTKSALKVTEVGDTARPVESRSLEKRLSDLGPDLAKKVAESGIDPSKYDSDAFYTAVLLHKDAGYITGKATKFHRNIFDNLQLRFEMLKELTNGNDASSSSATLAEVSRILDSEGLAKNQTASLGMIINKLGYKGILPRAKVRAEAFAAPKSSLYSGKNTVLVSPNVLTGSKVPLGAALGGLPNIFDTVELVTRLLAPRDVSNAQRLDEGLAGTKLISLLTNVSSMLPGKGKAVVGGLGAFIGLVPQLVGLLNDPTIQDPTTMERVMGPVKELGQMFASLGAGIGLTKLAQLGTTAGTATSFLAGLVPVLALHTGTWANSKLDQFSLEMLTMGGADPGKVAPEFTDKGSTALSRNWEAKGLLLREVQFALSAFGKMFKEKGAGFSYPGFAEGGRVPGKPSNTDSVLAALTPGEFVIRKEAVQALGTSYLDSLNNSGGLQKRGLGGIISKLAGYFSPEESASAERLNDERLWQLSIPYGALMRRTISQEDADSLAEIINEHYKTKDTIFDFDKWVSRSILETPDRQVNGMPLTEWVGTKLNTFMDAGGFKNDWFSLFVANDALDKFDAEVRRIYKENEASSYGAYSAERDAKYWFDKDFYKYHVDPEKGVLEKIKERLGFATGGRVPNTPNLSKPYGTDSVLAALTPGEFVIRKEAVQALGTPYLESLNRAGLIQKRPYGGEVISDATNSLKRFLKLDGAPRYISKDPKEETGKQFIQRIAADALPTIKIADQDAVTKRLEFMYGMSADSIYQDFIKQGAKGGSLIEILLGYFKTDSVTALDSYITNAFNTSDLTKQLLQVHGALSSQDLINRWNEQFPELASTKDKTAVEWAARYHGVDSLGALAGLVSVNNAPLAETKKEAEAVKEAIDGVTEEKAVQMVQSYVNDPASLQASIDASNNLMDENGRWAQGAQQTPEYNALSALAQANPNSVAPMVLANPGSFSLTPYTGGNTAQVGRFKVKLNPGESVSVNPDELESMVRTMFYGGNKDLIQGAMNWGPYFKGFDLKQVQSGAYMRDEVKGEIQQYVPQMREREVRQYKSGFQLEQEAAGRQSARQQELLARQQGYIKDRADRIAGFQQKRVDAYNAVQTRNENAQRMAYESGHTARVAENQAAMLAAKDPAAVKIGEKARAQSQEGYPFQTGMEARLQSSAAYQTMTGMRAEAQSKEGYVFKTGLEASKQSGVLKSEPVLEDPYWKKTIQTNLDPNYQKYTADYGFINESDYRTNLQTQSEVEERMKRLKRTGYAAGGLVAGSPMLSGYGSDTIAAALTPGEFVINRDAANNLGLDLLNGLNSGENIREHYRREIPGSIRRATDIDIENIQAENNDAAPTMFITAQDMNSTKVLNDVFNVLRRELKGMNVDRTHLPF